MKSMMRIALVLSAIVYPVLCLMAAPSAFAAPSLLAIRIDATAVADPIEGVTGIEITVNQNDWGFFDGSPPWYVTQTYSGLPGFLGTDWVRNSYADGKLTYSGTAPLGGDAVRALDGLTFSNGPPVVKDVKLVGYDGPVTYWITSPGTWNQYDYYELYIVLAPSSSANRPPWDWPTSTPAEQYMDGTRLDQMMAYIDQNSLAMDSVIVIRRGHIVLEAYPNPRYYKDVLHIANSVTKSFVSALVGIAIDQGRLSGTDQKMTDLFPDKDIQNLDARKQRITLEHILTMQPGMEWDEWGTPYDRGCEYPEAQRNDYVNALWCQDDPVQFVLDLPMVAEPGTDWEYNGGTSHLLSTLIASYTDTNDTLAFAREFLFEPLGISGSQWELAGDGVRQGGGGLFLKPRDMARFGYLYLHDGVWQGEQVVPAEFVAEAVKTQSYPYGGTEFGYGYQSWWTYPDSGVYYADGINGQKIYVVPDLDLVVVFTAYIPSNTNTIQHPLLFDYIIPAANPIPSLPLSDAITVLKYMAGVETISEQLSVEDIDGDSKIGLAEAIYVLEMVSGVRN